jgi:tetratricopeptide (TPR) repeat protein
MDSDFADWLQAGNTMPDLGPQMLRLALGALVLVVVSYWLISSRTGRFRGPAALLRVLGIVGVIAGGLGLRNFAVGLGGFVLFLVGDVIGRRKTALERGLLQLNRKKYRHAVAHLSLATTRAADAARAYFYRGVAHQHLEDNEAAVADFTEALRLDVQPASVAYGCRGFSRLGCGQTDEAIADLSEAIARGSDRADQCYLCRGQAYFSRGEYAQAIRDFEASIRHNPDNAQAHAFLAGMLASAPDERLRDGAKAIQLAQHACDLTEWKEWLCLGALAAAYAEVGDFPEAVHRARQSVEFAPEKFKAERQARLEEYLAGKPHRFPPPATPSPQPANGLPGPGCAATPHNSANG